MTVRAGALRREYPEGVTGQGGKHNRHGEPSLVVFHKFVEKADS
jgi:hypothetical protein